MPDYALCGLTVRIDGALSGLRAAAIGSVPDVEVHLQRAPLWANEPLAEDGVVYRADTRDEDAPVLEAVWLRGRDGVRLSYDDGTTFYVRADGREVWAVWPTTMTLADTTVYLLGPVLGYVLRRLGVLSLHASAVVIDRQVFAFCGAPGAGKSTTAAAFALRGHSAMTDDVLALRLTGGIVMASPAYAHLRLWPESAHALVGDDARLTALAPGWPKLAFPLDEFGAGLSGEPLPLGGIFLLMPRSTDERAPYVEPARGAEALLDLVSETSANYLLDGDMRAAELTMIARVTERVPLRRVTPHADMARLSTLVDVVLGASRA